MSSSENDSDKSLKSRDSFKSKESVTSVKSFKFISSASSASLVEESSELRRRFVKDGDNYIVSSEEEEDDKLLKAKADIHEIKESFNTTTDTFPLKHANLIIILVAIFFRILVGLHSYSGAGTPPIYGDFEAQRHWMEVTINVPLKDWYRNTGANDLSYWGLDYPPLSAYWAYLTGHL